MARSDDRQPPTQVVIKSGGSTTSLAMTALATAGLLFLAYLGYQLWSRATNFDPTALVKDTKPVVTSTGPTLTQLKNLKDLVSAHVHVADVLVAESRYLKGSWIVQGDALIAVDLAGAEIQAKDEPARTARLVLPPPRVLSPRVDHNLTREWDIRSNTWIPGAATLLGNRDEMQKEAMRQCQQLVERAAGASNHLESARKQAELALREFYNQVGWTVTVGWSDRPQAPPAAAEVDAKAKATPAP